MYQPGANSCAVLPFQLQESERGAFAVSRSPAPARSTQGSLAARGLLPQRLPEPYVVLLCFLIPISPAFPDRHTSVQKLPAHTSLCMGQQGSPVLGLKALVFPFAARWKINCFHATLCTGGQGLHPAHSDTVYEQTPREPCTDEALHLPGMQLLPGAMVSAASGQGAREALRCQTHSRAPFHGHTGPSAVPEVAGSTKGPITPCAYRTDEPNLV